MALSSSPDCAPRQRDVTPSSSVMPHPHLFSQRHGSRPGPFRPAKSSPSLYHGLLILMLILCFSPISTLAIETVVTSDLSTKDPRSASGPSVEIVHDDLRERSSDTQPRAENRSPSAGSASSNSIDESLLARRATSSSSDSSDDLPTAFDTLSNNFANASCVAFFEDFRANATVTNCHAVSLLLENSNSFFHILSNSSATSHVLDVACSQSVAKCASIMTTLAKEMLDDDNCGQDYDSNNSVVQGTYQDLMAYEPIYLASCLTNPDTDDYCFVDAVTNTTAPDDYNVYFIPIGSTLTSGKLTCNTCLKQTMKIFSEWASVDDQSLDTTYIPSAKVVNQLCGANFATTNVTVGSDAVTSGAKQTTPVLTILFPAAFLGLAFGAAGMGVL
ncbi:hypothetical protein N7462_002979 [Penicillium macrosclerotiorum]|uniref:uncharacterized protein n=1 Tax=Penicillium macrosclerotiorum TaxID=303699 RepID=UPI002547B2A2|nr:uncharacterized protein N7462_002979 [Penicillium macrosclerotiorum]KAJ5688587.1 hypothetical protein N7462_002979 [Penicillium macrosclerotiorum]